MFVCDHPIPKFSSGACATESQLVEAICITQATSVNAPHLSLVRLADVALETLQNDREESRVAYCRCGAEVYLIIPSFMWRRERQQVASLDLQHCTSKPDPSPRPTLQHNDFLLYNRGACKAL